TRRRCRTPRPSGTPVMESLRLHPIAPGITRTVATPFEFGGFEVEEGAIIQRHLPEDDRERRSSSRCRCPTSWTRSSPTRPGSTQAASRSRGRSPLAMDATPDVFIHLDRCSLSAGIGRPCHLGGG